MTVAGGSTKREVREHFEISKKDLEEALKDPETKATVERGLKIRGVTVEDVMNRSGFLEINLDWDKTYNEHVSNVLTDREDVVIKSDIALNNAELDALGKIGKKIK
jgi:hypothetical protein